MDTGIDETHELKRKPRIRSRATWIWLGFIAVAGFFLLTEHRAHTLGMLPFLLVAACPLMHLLHHGGHGSHGRHVGNDGRHTNSGKEMHE